MCARWAWFAAPLLPLRRALTPLRTVAAAGSAVVAASTVAEGLSTVTGSDVAESVTAVVTDSVAAIFGTTPLGPIGGIRIGRVASAAASVVWADTTPSMTACAPAPKAVTTPETPEIIASMTPPMSNERTASSTSCPATMKARDTVSKAVNRLAPSSTAATGCATSRADWMAS